MNVWYRSMIRMCVGLATSTVLADDSNTTTLPDVTVTAESRARELLDQPRRVQPSLEISQSVIEQAEIQRQGARTLADAMRYQPGTWSETRGRKVKQFVSFRGQMYPYPDFAWNGLWMPEFHEMPYLVPSGMVERMEILRSPASLFMGVSGDVGVVNLVPRAPEGPRQLMLRTGSQGMAEATVFVPMNPESGGWAFGGGHYRTDGPDGKHAEEDLSHAMLSGEWATGDNGTLSFQALALTNDRELSYASPPAGKRLQTTRERYEPFRAALAGLRWDVEHADASRSSFGIGSAYRDNDFINDGADGHVSMREEDYSITVDSTHVRALSDTNRLRLGTVYNHYAAPEGKRFIEGRRVDVDTLALTVADEQQLGSVLFDAGARISTRYFRDYAGFSLNGSSAGLESVSPVVDEWEDPRLRVTAGARWFMSTRDELFVHGGHDVIQPRSGTLDVEETDPENERRINGELGFRHSEDNGSVWELTTFVVDRQDALLIDGSTAFTASGRELELYRNQDLRQYGVETGFRDLPLSEALRAFANLTFVNSEARSEGSFDRYEDIPQWIGSVGLDAVRGSWFSGLYLKHVSDYESARFAADSKPKPLGDFVDVQFRLGRWITENLSVTLAVENLLDDEYSTVVGYPDSGRRGEIRFDLKW